MKLTIALAALALAAHAQELQIPAGIEKLAQKAEETVDVTLDKAMLQMMGRFLGDGDAHSRKLIAGLDRIVVRSFGFAREGEYSTADLDSLKAQLQPPAWSRVVGVHSKLDGENAEVFFKSGSNAQLGGIVVICADPRSLTIVNLTGSIDPSQLADLGGRFGIPRLEMAYRRGR